MGKTKETFWITQNIDLHEGGRRNFSLCILNKHFRGLSCIFEFESHFFEFFFFFIFKLYNIVLVFPNIEMNPPQVYLCSPS